MKINVLVSGCNGHMGQIVCELVKKDPDMELLYGFDKAAKEFSDFQVFEDIRDIEDFAAPDVIIDFSSPSCTNAILAYAHRNSVPLVIATTGFHDEDLRTIHSCTNDIPIFMSPNMSYEVALINNMLRKIAPKLSGCDIEIVETHHNRKKDTPSGTAKMLAEGINESLNNSMRIVYGREGKRKADEIGISSLRGGNIVGEHTVNFYGANETLSITHTALSRELFAEGAIRAAKFIVDKPAKLYCMDDLI